MKQAHLIKRQRCINIKVSIISSGQVVGLEDMSKEGSKFTGMHQATVTCVSEKANVYFLSSDVSQKFFI